MAKLSWRGYAALSLSQAMVGANIIISKYLVTLLPVYVILQYRFFVSLCILLICLLFMTRQPIHCFRRRDWLMLFLQGLFANFLFNSFIVHGVKLTTGVAAGIITSFMPALIAILAWLFLRETVGKRRFLGILFGVLGLLCVSLGTPHHGAHRHTSLIGMILVFIGLIPEASYTIIAKSYRTHIPQIQQAVWIMVFTSLLFLPFSYPDIHWQQITTTPLKAWLLLCLAASFSAMFFILWPWGLRHVKANVSALFVAVMPISAVLVATLILGEHFNIYDGIGLFFVLLAIVIGTVGVNEP